MTSDQISRPHEGACTCPLCMPDLWAAGIKGSRGVAQSAGQDTSGMPASLTDSIQRQPNQLAAEQPVDNRLVAGSTPAPSTTSSPSKKCAHGIDDTAYPPCPDCEHRKVVAERDRLRAALTRYGRHVPSCLPRTNEGICTCGFDAALEGTHSETEAGTPRREAGDRAGPRVSRQFSMWAFLRNILEQGMAINMDYAAGKYPSYEHLSSRLDDAAREREVQYEHDSRQSETGGEQMKPICAGCGFSHAANYPECVWNKEI